MVRAYISTASVGSPLICKRANRTLCNLLVSLVSSSTVVKLNNSVGPCRPTDSAMLLRMYKRYFQNLKEYEVSFPDHLQITLLPLSTAVRCVSLTGEVGCYWLSAGVKYWVHAEV